jgi:hypothetical protein
VARAATQRGSYTRLRYAGLGMRLDVVIDPGGERVWADYGDGVDDADVAAVLCGTVIGAVLRLRGLTCLHASVVAFDGRAVALVGAKGAGKSSTALALVRAGATLVSDDIAVVTRDGAEVRVRHGQPKLRLRPDPAAALLEPGDRLAPLWGEGEHRPARAYLELAGAEAPDPEASDLPLAAVHVLGPRGAEAPHLVPLSGPAALARLMAHRYVPYMLDQSGHARDFALLSGVCADVPVHAVERPEGLESLPDVAALLRPRIPAGG